MRLGIKSSAGTFAPALVAVLGLSLGAAACEYNVRDLGFIDAPGESLSLFLYVDRNASSETVALLRDTAGKALDGSNIHVEVVDIDNQTNRAGLAHLREHPLTNFPCAVLVSPDGQSMPVAAGRLQNLSREQLGGELSSLILSPKRQELATQALARYAVVLLIEGSDPEENTRALKAVDAAIAQIGSQMKGLPKAIKEPPVCVKITPGELEAESFLLWVLGLKPIPTMEARAAIFYGKVRWMGPIMHGAEISEPNLTGLLAFIGEDCECGLDVAWVRGTRIPFRWTEELNAMAAKNIGFDPEDPMVRLQADRIVRKARDARKALGADKEPQQIKGGGSLKTVPARPPERQTAGLRQEGDQRRVYRRAVATLAAVGGVAFVAAATILARVLARRRHERLTSSTGPTPSQQ